MHVLKHPAAKVALRVLKSSHIEDCLRDLEATGASGSSVNPLRRNLHAVFAQAVKAGKWIGPNPVDETPKRRVTKRLYDTLRAEEVPVLLAACTPEWRGIIGTAVYAGLRKGEVFGLRKSDLDFREKTITVARSYDQGTTKGGHVDVIPNGGSARPDPRGSGRRVEVRTSMAKCGRPVPPPNGPCAGCSRVPGSSRDTTTLAVAAKRTATRTRNATATMPCGSARSAG